MMDEFVEEAMTEEGFGYVRLGGFYSAVQQDLGGDRVLLLQNENGVEIPASMSKLFRLPTMLEVGYWHTGNMTVCRRHSKTLISSGKEKNESDHNHMYFSNGSARRGGGFKYM